MGVRERCSPLAEWDPASGKFWRVENCGRVALDRLAGAAEAMVELLPQLRARWVERSQRLGTVVPINYPGGDFAACRVVTADGTVAAYAPFQPWVTDEFAGPRRCDTCGDVSVKRKMVCGGCRTQRYCSRECQRASWSRHKTHCGMYGFSSSSEAAAAMSMPEGLAPGFGFSVNGMRSDALVRMGVHLRGAWRACDGNNAHLYFGMLTALHAQDEALNDLVASLGLDPVTHAHFNQPVDPSAGTVASWEEYYALRGLDRSSPLAAVLSFALTCYHAVVDAGLHLQPSLRLLYIGAEMELDMLPTFGEIGHLLPNMRLEIIMVCTKGTSGVPVAQLGGTVAPNARVIVVEGDASRYVKGVDLAVGLNAGFEVYPEWEGVLSTLVTNRVRAYFTDYVMMSALTSMTYLADAGARLACEPKVNPFRSPAAKGEPGVGMCSCSNHIIFSIAPDATVNPQRWLRDKYVELGIKPAYADIMSRQNNHALKRGPLGAQAEEALERNRGSAHQGAHW